MRRWREIESGEIDHPLLNRLVYDKRKEAVNGVDHNDIFPDYISKDAESNFERVERT